MKQPKQQGPLERRAEKILLGALVAFTLAAILATALGGCVSEKGGDDGPTPQCETTDQCPSGTICGDDGFCYGNPPALHFAAELVPPSGTDLVRTDLGTIDISPTGDVTMSFAEPITIKGRVVASQDPTQGIVATVVFRRPSRVAGGPDMIYSFDSIGDEGFEARIPPSLPNEPYEITVYPDDGVLYQPPPGTPTPASLLPPRRTIEVLDASREGYDLVLGDVEGMKQITGRVVDAVGVGIPDLRVRAYGRFLPTTNELELASSRGTTDAQGYFSVFVPQTWQDLFDLRIEPGAGQDLPSIVRHDVYIPDPQPGMGRPMVDIGDIGLPSFGDPQDYTLGVFGESTGGGPEPADGALVRFATTLFTDEFTEVTYRTTATVDLDGYAHARLIPGSLGEGNRHYVVDVIPLPGTPHGAIWGVGLDVLTGGLYTLPDATLPRRVFVTGRVVDANGVEVEGVDVSAVPSAYFVYGLDDAQRAIASQFTWPTTQTSSDGSFAVYVDPAVLGAQATYDLQLAPPEVTLLPRWTVDQLTFTETDSLEAFDLGDLGLPNASLAHGPVVSPDGSEVPGAEVRIYEVDDMDGGLCAQFSQIVDCHAPARLRALTNSDDHGWVRLVLPSP